MRRLSLFFRSAHFSISNEQPVACRPWLSDRNVHFDTREVTDSIPGQDFFSRSSDGHYSPPNQFDNDTIYQKDRGRHVKELVHAIRV